MSKRPIYLIGPMGVGKSTVGPLLARRLGRPFVDSDHEIESRTGRTVAAIFAEQGEAVFRQIEAETIDALSKRDAVIALGGGAIVPPGALQRLQELGRTVYLEASAEILIERIGDASSRPLLAGLDDSTRVQKLREILDQRRSVYEEADLRISATGEAAEVVERILASLGSDA